MKVKISKDAFVPMVANCVEVYKREAIGLFLGKKQNGNILLTDALSYQAVRQKYSEVETVGNRNHRLEHVIETLGQNKVVGNYHSHPSFGENYYQPCPSKYDIGEMRKSPSLALVLVEIYDKKTDRDWHYCSDGRLAGAFGEYWLNIAAYYWDEQANRHRKAAIVCPYAIRKKRDFSLEAMAKKSEEVEA